MIYEMRTYTLKPGSVDTVEKIFGEALPHREKYSKLTAFRQNRPFFQQWSMPDGLWARGPVFIT